MKMNQNLIFIIPTLMNKNKYFSFFSLIKKIIYSYMYMCYCAYYLSHKAFKIIKNIFVLIRSVIRTDIRTKRKLEIIYIDMVIISKLVAISLCRIVNNLF